MLVHSTLPLFGVGRKEFARISDVWVLLLRGIICLASGFRIMPSKTLPSSLFFIPQLNIFVHGFLIAIITNADIEILVVIRIEVFLDLAQSLTLFAPS